MSEQVKCVYFETVWERYLERNDAARIMSPIEYALVRYWWEQGVPLRLVLGAIRDTKPSRTLLYLEGPVAQAVKRSSGGM
jgi:hypothetical protein